MQVAIVTGASSGIGFGCATKLAEEGMTVLGTGRDDGRLAELKGCDPDHIETIAVDLTADDGPRRIVDAAMERWGRIDFLINNAGVGSPKPLHETDDESLDYFLGLMLRAPFRLAREAVVHMKSGSAIINVTSTFAVVGGLRGGAYSAAKGGLTSLTRHIACQYGPLGIRCNAVAPGVTLTPMVATRLEDPRFRKINTEMTPYPRLGEVNDIASTVAFLCSDGASFINGQEIVVDGGWTSTKYLSDFALNADWVARQSTCSASWTRLPPVSVTAARCSAANVSCIRGASCATVPCGWRPRSGCPAAASRLPARIAPRSSS